MHDDMRYRYGPIRRRGNAQRLSSALVALSMIAQCPVASPGSIALEALAADREMAEQEQARNHAET